MTLVLYNNIFFRSITKEIKEEYTIFKEYIFSEDILQRPNNSFRAFAPKTHSEITKMQEAVKQRPFNKEQNALLLDHLVAI